VLRLALSPGDFRRAALAHRSFDRTKRQTLVGTIPSFEWINPLAFIEISSPQ
jgi:hypothetical protein